MRGIIFVRFAAVSGALLVASFVSFPSFPHAGAGWSDSNPPAAVDRTFKGDRLPVVTPIAQPRQQNVPELPRSRSVEKAPLGCDAAFSSISTPRPANVFRRCTV
jgi:hypothetical protein